MADSSNCDDTLSVVFHAIFNRLVGARLLLVVYLKIKYKIYFRENCIPKTPESSKSDTWGIFCVCKDFNWFLACLVSIYMQNIIKPLGTHSLAQTQTHQHKDKNTLKHIKRMIMMMMVMLMSFKLLRGIKIRKKFRRVTISWCRTQGTRQVRFDRIKCDCFWLFLFFLSLSALFDGGDERSMPFGFLFLALHTIQD